MQKGESSEYKHESIHKHNATENMRNNAMNGYSHLVTTNMRNTTDVRRGRHPPMVPSYDFPTMQRRMPR